ncbi:hypothetical protein CI109_100380 [Kwoniella shandongensis]|uniref:Uncharacterized protein n=1 Tax=Kwoniella shandongensis TaxID=1734106 RepID=A0A5M6C3W1_9TREE|nr:uncharacterized protein CI109_001777 [Kwoniella shandongensis]KAA5529837.1 hypothetical protein CI109_001777 [Kwoniella shandongensis]
MSTIPGQTAQWLRNPPPGSRPSSTSSNPLQRGISGLKGLGNAARRGIGNTLNNVGSYISPSEGSSSADSSRLGPIPSILTDARYPSTGLPTSSNGSWRPSTSSSSGTGSSSSGVPSSYGSGSSIPPQNGMGGPPSSYSRPPGTAEDIFRGSVQFTSRPDGSKAWDIDLTRAAEALTIKDDISVTVQPEGERAQMFRLRSGGAGIYDMEVRNLADGQSAPQSSSGYTGPTNGTPTSDASVPSTSTAGTSLPPGTANQPSSASQPSTDTADTAGTDSSAGLAPQFATDSETNNPSLVDLARMAPPTWGVNAVKPVPLSLGDDTVRLADGVDLMTNLTRRYGFEGLDGAMSAYYNGKEWLKKRYLSETTGKSLLDDRGAGEITPTMFTAAYENDGTESARTSIGLGCDKVISEVVGPSLGENDQVLVVCSNEFPTWEELSTGPEVKSHQNESISKYFSDRVQHFPQDMGREFMNNVRALSDRVTRRYSLSSKSGPILSWRIATALMDDALLNNSNEANPDLINQFDEVVPRAASAIQNMPEEQYRSIYCRKPKSDTASFPSSADDSSTFTSNPSSTFTGSDPSYLGTQSSFGPSSQRNVRFPYNPVTGVRPIPSRFDQ